MIRYGLDWGSTVDPVRVEMHMIQSGGYFVENNRKFGEGLFFHYKALQMLLWPEDEDHHRWSDLILKEILDNRITVLGGAKDTGKTHVGLSRYGITDYLVFPDKTLILVSSTDARGLQLRVFGDMKDMLSRAKERHPWLPGNVVESKMGVFTDQLGPHATVRDMRKGIICVPCAGGEGENLEGLEKFIGAKQKRRRLLGDEVQFMDNAYLNVMSNFDKGDFKGVFCGNFLGRGDPLDQLAEPKLGWARIGEPKKTVVWDNLKGGRTVNLVGDDSPNFDPPESDKPRYPYLITRDDMQRVAMRYGDDSLQYWSQIKGIRKTDLMGHRVLTMDICRMWKAFAEVIWEGSPRTKIYALDAAFGGDRPIRGMCEFGQDVNGHNVFACHKPSPIQLKISAEDSVEVQLAKACKADMDALGIPYGNFFFDAGMRATLATEVARIISVECNAVNFGGVATDRPVSQDDFIDDPKTRERRLKRCNEAYSKFVTELAYSVRMVVEAGQMRQIPESTVREFEMREWYKVSGDRIELETKKETKARMGQSPDEADWLGICVEGARRRGFQIAWVGKLAQVDKDAEDWLAKELEKFKTYQRKHELKYDQS